MITNLRLTRFGAFNDRELPFGTVTLFVGPNESGKTTIVDALCEVLCRPRSNRIAGKRLALRYGTDRLVSAEFDGEPMTIPEDAFHDLFAIRSGELTLDVRPGSSWVETLKADLFTAGLDPKRLHAALARRASTDGGSRHNRELRQLREEQGRLEERRDLLEERVVAARAAETSVAEQRAERSRLADELDGLSRTLDQRQRHARHRLQQAEQREAERLLQRFAELSQEPEAVPASSGEAAARLQELSDASDAAAQEVTRARAELEQARRHLQDPSGGASGRPAVGEAGGVAGIAAGVALGVLAGAVLAVLALIVGVPAAAAATAGVVATAGSVAIAALIRRRAAGVETVREETDRAAERLRVRRERHDQLERELRDFLERHGAQSREQLLMQLGGARADEARRRDAETGSSWRRRESVGLATWMPWSRCFANSFASSRTRLRPSSRKGRWRWRAIRVRLRTRSICALALPGCANGSTSWTRGWDATARRLRPWASAPPRWRSSTPAWPQAFAEPPRWSWTAGRPASPLSCSPGSPTSRAPRSTSCPRTSAPATRPSLGNRPSSPTRSSRPR